MPATFIIIGAMKSGTSTLRENLRSHPQISMTRTGEPSFFVEELNWSRGMKWYEDQFDLSQPIRGDSSPNYTKHPVFPGVPERIKATLPDARLVYILRDPIKRIVSHFAHNLASGREHRTVEEVFLNGPNAGGDNGYVQASMYHMQLSRFTFCFSTDQILILTMEKLSVSPATVMARLFEFIGADAHIPPKLGHNFHDGAAKTTPTWLTRPLLKIPGGAPVRNLVRPWLEPKLVRPTLSEEVRERLRELLDPDIALLRQATGLSFNDWSL